MQWISSIFRKCKNLKFIAVPKNARNSLHQKSKKLKVDIWLEVDPNVENPWFEIFCFSFHQTMKAWSNSTLEIKQTIKLCQNLKQCEMFYITPVSPTLLNEIWKKDVFLLCWQKNGFRGSKVANCPSCFICSAKKLWISDEIMSTGMFKHFRSNV